MIPEGFITNLLDRADIADVVGRYVPLKKAGRNLMACCPFHKEKTPSFSVSPTKQIYKCFGCGASGNAIGFVMAYEGLEFPEAVRKLAGFYGMVVPEDQTPGKVRQREKARTLTDYMGEAAAFYTKQLAQSQKAIDYLKDRAILSETATRFGLGYSPDEWHALKGLFQDRYGAKELEECGLVNVKNDRRYDAFRGRIMYPIRNVKGQVIGFGARTMNGDEQPKYLNSPETPIYHKGSELYGLYEGREAIHQKGRAIVCEGYMDVIQLSQAGFTESVAALGTSITTEHVHKLFKLADNVYFSFDGDGAGRKAARRALEATLPVITDVQKAGFIILPPEHDPDSLIKAEGPQAYEAQIEKAYTLTNFLKLVLIQGKELQYAEERAKIVAEAKPLVLSMQKAPILQLTVIKEIAGIARLTADEIQRQYGLMPAAPRVTPTRSRGWGNSSNRSGFYGQGRYGERRFFSGRMPPEERVRVKDLRERMLQCFLSYPELLSRFSPQIEEEFLNTEHPIAQCIVELWQLSMDEDGRPVHSAASLMERVKESNSLPYFTTLLNEELNVDTPLETATLEVRRAFLDLELERVSARLDECGYTGNFDPAVVRPLMTRRAELRNQINELAESERAYRQQVDIQSRWASQDKIEKKGKSGLMELSSNPIVRQLQEHLMGRDAVTATAGEGSAAPATSTAPTASAAPALPSGAPRPPSIYNAGVAPMAPSIAAKPAGTTPPAVGARPVTPAAPTTQNQAKAALEVLEAHRREKEAAARAAAAAAMPAMPDMAHAPSVDDMPVEADAAPAVDDWTGEAPVEELPPELDAAHEDLPWAEPEAGDLENDDDVAYAFEEEFTTDDDH